MPLLGSSNKTASTPPTSAMPRASFLLLPPLYCPAGRNVISSGMVTRRSTSATASSTWSLPTPYTQITAMFLNAPLA